MCCHNHNLHSDLKTLPIPLLPSAGLDPETLAVIWTMVDRQEPESPHAPFWAALPAHFGSALSAPQPQLDLLKGVPLFQECVSARAHVRQQFEALQQTFK